MFQALFNALTRRPESFAEHVGAYAQLLGIELEEAAVITGRKVRLRIVFFLLLGVGCLFGGIALIIVSAIPWHSMPAPWGLIAVPGVPLFGALWAWTRIREPLHTGLFSTLGEQMSIDIKALRELHKESSQ
jgi:hypothetical protein